jgi:hypothetical protein
MILKTECICFPRSGHHLLANVLRDYFGEEFHYCEFYTEPHLTFENCAATNYQKNHDKDLLTPTEGRERYIIQIRNPLDALASLRNLEAGETPLHEFAPQHLDYFAGFVRKWVFVPPDPRRLLVQYRDLINRPFATVGQVIEHITGGGPINGRRLIDVVTAHDIRWR